MDYLEAYLAEAKRLNMAAVDQAIQSNNTDQLQIEGKTFCRMQKSTQNVAVVLIIINLIFIIFSYQMECCAKASKSRLWKKQWVRKKELFLLMTTYNFKD